VFAAPTALLMLVAANATATAPGTHAHYLVLTTMNKTPAPFAAVDLVYGPVETVEGKSACWWQLGLRAQEGDKEPSFQIQALTSRDPLARAAEPLKFYRYILQVADTQEVLEYRNIHTGRALLPVWIDFDKYFTPVRAKGSHDQQGAAETCTLLGHVLTLKHVGTNVPFKRFDNAKVLDLDPELLVGTSRNFKDTEGHRLPQKPQRQNYTYTPFTAEDYPVMIKAGINLFCISPEQEPFVRGEPVFYIRGVGGKKQQQMRWPTDFYRSNYFCPQMFIDEPTCIMVGDQLIHRTLKYWSDAAALIEHRVREHYHPDAAEGALRSMGVNLGSMHLLCEYPSWETMYDTTYYQMAGGACGLVHEGRYQLAEFDKAVAKWLPAPKQHTAEQLLRYYYAFLRGGTRAFGKYWGTAIYGQCDPKISPDAMKLAYDMGARYIWFWTSDHDHHIPYVEQLELTRALKAHASEHPRQSVFAPPAVRDLAITIPYGYFLSLDNMWWVRVMDVEGKNDASVRFRRLMQRAHQAIETALDQKQDFDITVDDGREIIGYRKIIRITDEP
jgi:hypothetical protein